MGDITGGNPHGTLRAAPHKGYAWRRQRGMRGLREKVAPVPAGAGGGQGKGSLQAGWWSLERLVPEESGNERPVRRCGNGTAGLSGQESPRRARDPFPGRAHPCTGQPAVWDFPRSSYTLVAHFHMQGVGSNPRGHPGLPGRHFIIFLKSI